MDRPVLPARKGDVSLEHIVRGDVDEMRPPFRRHLGQDTGSDVVQQVRHLHIVLGLVHVRIGRAVHDHVYLLRIADEPDGIPVGNIQIDRIHPGKRGDVREDVAVGSSRGDVPQLGSQLTVGAGDKYVHDGT